MMKSKVLSGLAIFAAVAVVASGLAVAQDPIAKRRDIMKAVGGAAKAGGQMVKGEAPFDGKKAAEVMSAVAGSIDEFLKLYPDSAKSGGETTASPAVWEKRADFEKLAVAFKAKAAAAATAAGKGAADFKAAFGEFGGTCKGCHEVYRVQKK